MGTPWGCVFFRKRPEEVATAMVPLLLSASDRWNPSPCRRNTPYRISCLIYSSMMGFYNLKPKKQGKYHQKRCSAGNQGIYIYILGLIDTSTIRTKHQQNRQRGLVRVSEHRLSGCHTNPSTNVWIALSEYDGWRMQGCPSNSITSRNTSIHLAC